MIKYVSTTKNEIKVEGVLKGYDDSGFLIEDEKSGEKQILDFKSILKQFKDKFFKFNMSETSKEEEEI